MENKKRKRLLLLLVLLLAVSVGFALISTTLKINGTAGISKNIWNIYWDNVANESGVTAEKPEITSDENGVPKTLVSWTVDLDKPGDYYEFTVDAVNAGTLDAEITRIDSRVNDSAIVTTNSKTGELVVSDPSPVPSYIKYTVKYADGTDIALGDKLLRAPDLTSTPKVLTRKTYKIHVEYDKSAITNELINTMTESQSYEFALEVTYGQKGTPHVTPAESFPDDPWPTIIDEGNDAAEQEEVVNGKCGAYHIGDTKTIDMGSLGTHTIRIANCSTPAICKTEGFSQSACGFVLEFTDILGSDIMNPYEDVVEEGNGSNGGWPASYLRGYINSSNIYGKIPKNLKKYIVSTKVVSGYGLYDSGNFTTYDKLYLLSTHEVFDDDDQETSGESQISVTDTAYDKTRQLDYYKGNKTSNMNGKAVKVDNSAYWWLRTPYAGYGFYTVVGGGGYYVLATNYESGISPAFKVKN